MSLFTLLMFSVLIVACPMHNDVHPEKALLFGPVYQDSTLKDATSLDELGRLVEAAGGVEVGRLVQLIKKPSSATFFGSGKIEELHELAIHTKADVAVFDDELSPAQARNIEKVLNIRVIDRSELILDIFASRARSHQAKLQVSLAQLKYKLPRLKRMWTHLDRIQAAIGARGPGETQIESDRRMIRKKIQEHTAKLDEITESRHRTIATRKDFKVSLVGYTNAGKSTLMRAITGSSGIIADQLFATLDTLTRHVKLPGAGTCLISDTVGFVNKLPHHLVSSFHATLSEAMEADLLLHVVDASDLLVMEHVKTVEDVLGSMGCSDLPTILVANKVDCEQAVTGLVELRASYPELIAISAKEGKGLDELLEMIAKDMSNCWKELMLKIPFDRGAIISTLRQHARILHEEAKEDGMIMHVQVAPALVKQNQLKKYSIEEETLVKD